AAADLDGAGPESILAIVDMGSGLATLSRPGMTKRDALATFSPQLPLVRRVVRLIDGELVHRGLPEMRGEARRFQIDLAARDPACQFAVQIEQRAVNSKQLNQSGGFRRIACTGQRQLPHDDIERIDRNAQLERLMARDQRGDVVAQEVRDSTGKFDRRWFVL